MIDVLGCGFAAVVFIFLLFASVRGSVDLAAAAAGTLRGAGSQTLGADAGVIPPASIRLHWLEAAQLDIRIAGTSTRLSAGQGITAFTTDSSPMALLYDHDVMSKGVGLFFSTTPETDPKVTFSVEQGNRGITVVAYVPASGTPWQVGQLSFRKGLKFLPSKEWRHEYSVFPGVGSASLGTPELVVLTNDPEVELPVPDDWRKYGFRVRYNDVLVKTCSHDAGEGVLNPLVQANADDIQCAVPPPPG